MEWRDPTLVPVPKRGDSVDCRRTKNLLDPSKFQCKPFFVRPVKGRFEEYKIKKRQKCVTTLVLDVTEVESVRFFNTRASS